MSDEVPANPTVGVEYGLVDGVAVGAERGHQGVERYAVDDDRDGQPALVRGEFLLDGPPERGRQRAGLGLVRGPVPESLRQPFPLRGVQRDGTLSLSSPEWA
jgi:hypothetical protein